MKAIRKRDGKEIDVVLCKQAEYLEEDPVTGGVCVYYEGALTLKGAVDWDAFRREAAMDMLAGMVHHRVLSDSSDRFYIPKEQVVSAAIGLADELIKQLREDKK